MKLVTAIASSIFGLLLATSPVYADGFIVPNIGVNFGYDVGAGVMGYFANHVGLRAGVQYFRNFERTGGNLLGLDAGEFNFYRGCVGVLFRF
ncbi:MAG: hypothetical protein ABJA98_21510 [Acidobacteriota bacterium]